MRHVYKVMTSPVGKLTLVASEAGLAAILWEHDRPGRVTLNLVSEDDEHPVLVEAARQLEEYFAGRRTTFDVALDFAGTPFQRKVWSALLAIPFGETRSYLEIATQVGNPKAVRAVGAANGRNPISIIAPCHRVIGANGTLTGYAGGLEAKSLLLALEARSETTPAQRRPDPASRTSARGPSTAIAERPTRSPATERPARTPAASRGDWGSKTAGRTARFR